MSEGAQWLHTVNLDGAFGEEASTNLKALRRILSAANGSAEVQYGGGLRDLASIDFILSLGVTRVILGSAAVSDPDFFKKALSTFGPSKVVLGVDAKDDRVRISGWEAAANLSPTAVIQQFIPTGLRTVIYTNIRRDGMLAGVDTESTRSLADCTGLNVIASGGVANLGDILSVKSAGLAGVVIGKALYDGSMTLEEALLC